MTFRPNPAVENRTWREVRCTCNTFYGMFSPDGTIMRVTCTDRRCKRAGKPAYTYWSLDAGDPRILFHMTFDPERGQYVEDSRHG